MRTLIIIPFILFSLFSFPSWSDEWNVKLVERDGLHYEKFSDIPFTGKVKVSLIGGGHYQGSYKNGKEVGEWLTFYGNGQLHWKVYKKNGKREGPAVSYYKDGQLQNKENYKNDKRHGPSISFHENGNVSDEGNWKNGKKVGEWVYYNIDGSFNSIINH